MPCEDFLDLQPYSNAQTVKSTLQHLALMALWTAGRQAAEDEAPEPNDFMTAIEVMGRRPR